MVQYQKPKLFYHILHFSPSLIVLLYLPRRRRILHRVAHFLEQSQTLNGCTSRLLISCTYTSVDHYKIRGIKETHKGKKTCFSCLNSTERHEFEVVQKVLGTFFVLAGTFFLCNCNQSGNTNSIPETRVIFVPIL